MKVMKFQLSPGSYQVVMYGMGIIIMKMVSLIMIPYVTRFLNPAQYGTLEVILTFFNLSSIVFGFGLAEAMFRYVGLTNSPHEQKKIAAVTNSLTIVISLALGFPLFFFVPTMAALLPGDVSHLQLNLMIVTIMVDTVIGVQLSWLRLKNKVKVFLWLSCGRAVLQALLVLVLLGLGYSVTGVIMAGVVSTSIIFIITFIIQLRDTGIAMDLGLYKRILIYGAPLSLTGIAAFATLGLAQWWLAKYIGVSEMAQYALAMKFAMVTAFIISPFSLWWQPRRFILLNEADGIAANARIATMGVTLSFISALFVGLAGVVAIEILTPKEFHQAIFYVPWLSMVWAIKNMGELLNLGCFTKQSTHQIFFIEYGSACIAIIGYYLLIPKYGIAGAIFSQYVTFIVRFLLFYYYSQKKLYLPYPIFKIFSICFLSMIACYLGSQVQGIILQSISAIVLVAALGFFGMWLGVVPKLQHLIRR